MNSKEFNRNLILIGERYQECVRLKNQLKSIRQDDIMISFTLLNKKERQGFNDGCIQKRDLLQCVNHYVEQRDNNHTDNYIHSQTIHKLKQIQKQIQIQKQHQQLSHNKNKQYLLSQLQEIFPHNKIAYTTLISTCLKGGNLSLQLNVQTKFAQKLTPYQIILSIIIVQLQINQIRKQLIPLIPIYIPITQTNLTLQQLKDYLLLLSPYINQLGRINPQSIILGLNGFGGKSDSLQYEFYSQKQIIKHMNYQQRQEQSDGEDQTMQRIQEIMLRLNKRVDKFGNQWLDNNQKDN